MFEPLPKAGNLLLVAGLLCGIISSESWTLAEALERSCGQLVSNFRKLYSSILLDSMDVVLRIRSAARDLILSWL